MKLKELAEQHGGVTFVDRIRMKNVLREEDSLVEELKAAEMLESGNDLEIALDGEPVRDHMVAAGFFGRVLTDLQELVELIGFFVESPSRVGETIPEASIGASRLMVTGWAPSSFTVKLRLPTEEELGRSFTVERRATLLRSIEGLLSEEVVREDLAALITKSASKAPYKRLLKNVARQGASLSLRTSVNPYGVELSAQGAKERVKWMEEKKEETQDLDLIGKLIGGNVKQKRFTLEVDEALYDGAVSKAAQEQMHSIKFGARVHAWVKRTWRYRERSSVEPTTKDFLVSIVKVEDEPAK